MKMIECPHCLTQVIPSENGECPACRSKLPEWLDNMAAGEEPWASELPEPLEEPVILARFPNAIEAQMAKNCLEASGIRAFVADAETAGMAWQLSYLIGGIKLEVSSRYLTQAQEILDKQMRSSASDVVDLYQQAIASESLAELDDNEIRYENVEEECDEVAHDDDDSEDDEEIELTDREKYAVSAFRSSILAALFVPAQFYTTYLIFVVLSSTERLEGPARNRFYIAIVINMIYLIAIGLFIGSLA